MCRVPGLGLSTRQGPSPQTHHSARICAAPSLPAPLLLVFLFLDPLVAQMPERSFRDAGQVTSPLLQTLQGLLISLQPRARCPAEAGPASLAAPPSLGGPPCYSFSAGLLSPRGLRSHCLLIPLPWDVRAAGFLFTRVPVQIEFKELNPILHVLCRKIFLIQRSVE